MYGIDGKKFQRQYKKQISDFETWTEKSHADEWLLFPDNLTEYLSIDEVALSRGELYTVVTSKSGKGKKGSIVAIICDTQSDKVVEHLMKISEKQRLSVKEITLDMSGSMKLIAKRCFPKATQVIDRFHVQKLASEALQQIRIKYRWEAIDEENEAISEAKKADKVHVAAIYENGDTKKQLLARSRYLLYKSRDNWTEKQLQRSEILFKEYPDLNQAYKLVQSLRTIYNQKVEKGVALTKLAHWYKDVENAKLETFNSVLNTFSIHYADITNYFNNRSTNASAESFNAKIKRFRIEFKGVRDKAFFLFRLKNIFA